MARQATSPEEIAQIAQIARVRGVLSGVIFAVPPDVVVTGTNRKKIAGRLRARAPCYRPAHGGRPFQVGTTLDAASPMPV